MWWWWESAFLSEGFRKEFISLPFPPFSDSLPLSKSLNLAACISFTIRLRSHFPLSSSASIFKDLFDHIWTLIIIQDNFPISRSLLLTKSSKSLLPSNSQFQGSGKEHSEAPFIWSITHIGENPRNFSLLYTSDNPLHYSCLENSMDRGTWQATFHEVAELDMTEHTCIHSSDNYWLKTGCSTLTNMKYFTLYKWMMWSPNVHSL